MVYFIKSISDVKLNSVSIQIAILSIANIHKLNRLNDPVNDPDVKLEMRHMDRNLGQEDSINQNLLKEIIKVT